MGVLDEQRRCTYVTCVSLCVCLEDSAVLLETYGQFTANRLEAIASRLEAIALRLEAITIWLEAIAIRLEAITIRLEAIY